MLQSFRREDNDLHILPLVLTLVGVEHQQEPVLRTQGMDIYQWIYCESGIGEVILAGKKVILHPGEGIMIFPGEPHNYHAVSEDWVVDIIGFLGNSAGAILSSIGITESGAYRLENEQEMKNYLVQILALQEDGEERSRRMSVICYDFLTCLATHVRRIEHSEGETENKILQQVIHYMENHYAEQISVEDIADAVHFSKGYLQVLFRKEFGMSIRKYLEQIRIVQARILLSRYPNMKIVEIAQACGFTSPSYFCKIFRRAVGMTPDQYRRSL